MQTTRILFLAANPHRRSLGGYLDLDEELRKIEERLAEAPGRESITLVPVHAVRPDDWLQALNAQRFRLVHFSGHGTRGGMLQHVGADGMAQPVSFEALKATLRALKGDICLIILNACYSRQQAELLAEDIDCVIAMNDEIHDRAAITFVNALYRALFAGKSVQNAFEQGRAALMLERLPGVHVPELLVRPGADAAQVTLLAPVHHNAAFITFSPDDLHFLQELHVHFTNAEQQGALAYWDTTRLLPGTRQRVETQRALASASAAILLISASFFACPAVVQEQLPLLLQAAERSDVKVFNVLLRPLALIDPRVAQFGMVNAQPLGGMSQVKRENVWSQLTTLVCEHLQAGRGG